MHPGVSKQLSMQQVITRKKKNRIVKAGIAFPREVLVELDKVVRELGIPNRSKAVVEATMRYIADNLWVYNKGLVAGALSIIYDDTNRNTQTKLLEIRNMYSYNINAAINLPLDDNKSIEVWIVKGSTETIKRLIESVEKIGGVYMLRAMIVYEPKK